MCENEDFILKTCPFWVLTAALHFEALLIHLQYKMFVLEVFCFLFGEYGALYMNPIQSGIIFIVLKSPLTTTLHGFVLSSGKNAI